MIVSGETRQAAPSGSPMSPAPMVMSRPDGPPGGDTSLDQLLAELPSEDEQSETDASVSEVSDEDDAVDTSKANRLASGVPSSATMTSTPGSSAGVSSRAGDGTSLLPLASPSAPPFLAAASSSLLGRVKSRRLNAIAKLTLKLPYQSKRQTTFDLLRDDHRERILIHLWHMCQTRGYRTPVTQGEIGSRATLTALLPVSMSSKPTTRTTALVSGSELMAQVNWPLTALVPAGRAKTLQSVPVDVFFVSNLSAAAIRWLVEDWGRWNADRTKRSETLPLRRAIVIADTTRDPSIMSKAGWPKTIEYFPSTFFLYYFPAQHFNFSVAPQAIYDDAELKVVMDRYDQHLSRFPPIGNDAMMRYHFGPDRIPKMVICHRACNTAGVVAYPRVPTAYSTYIPSHQRSAAGSTPAGLGGTGTASPPSTTLPTTGPPVGARPSTIVSSG